MYNQTLIEEYPEIISEIQTEIKKLENDTQVLNKNLQHQLIMEKPIAAILDNYSIHHAIVFTELCNILNIDIIHLPPYSPKYNPIEQVWRTIKAKISRKFITSIEQLKFVFENEFKQVFDNESYWKN